MLFEEDLQKMGLEWKGFTQGQTVDKFLERKVHKELINRKTDIHLYKYCAEELFRKGGMVKVTDYTKLPEQISKGMNMKGIQPSVLEGMYINFDEIQMKLNLRLLPFHPIRRVVNCVDMNTNKEFAITKEERLKIMFNQENKKQAELRYYERIERLIKKELRDINQLEEVQLYLNRLKNYYIEKVEQIREKRRNN